MQVQVLFHFVDAEKDFDRVERIVVYGSSAAEDGVGGPVITLDKFDIPGLRGSDIFGIYIQKYMTNQRCWQGCPLSLLLFNTETWRLRFRFHL